jgi:hypothetical protein
VQQKCCISPIYARFDEERSERDRCISWSRETFEVYYFRKRVNTHQEYPVKSMYRVLAVSESGYYAWRKRAQGIICGKHRVERLMPQLACGLCRNTVAFVRWIVITVIRWLLICCNAISPPLLAGAVHGA